MYFSDESTLDLDDGRRGDCPVRAESFVDALLTDDPTCGEAVNVYGIACSVAFTEDGEYVVYAFRKDPLQTTVSVTLRTASVSTRLLQVEILSQDDSQILASYDGTSPGTGSTGTYTTFTIWDQVNIGSEENYKLKIIFPNGGVNVCSLGFD
jgi:hypothetical protein